MLYLKAFGIWIILALSAIIIAIFRNGLLLPPFGEQTAHQVGTLVFLIVQFVIIFVFIKKNNLKERRLLLIIGIFWVIFTIIFEFLFGHYIIGHPWQKLFADYNIFNGRIWILVLINNLSAPFICKKIIK